LRDRLRQFFLLVALAVAAVAHFAVPCRGQIAGVTGTATIIAPPPSVVENTFESNTQIPVFVEHTFLVLSAAVGVDISSPGTIHSSSDFTPAIIDAGVAVSSTYIMFDPVGTSTLRARSGSVTFDEDILGIIYRTVSLTPTNAELGYPGTAYSTAANGAYGADYGQDPVTLSADRRKVTFQFSADEGEDSLRVLTDVPEPASLLMLSALPFLSRRKVGRCRSRRWGGENSSLSC